MICIHMVCFGTKVKKIKLELDGKMIEFDSCTVLRNENITILGRVHIIRILYLLKNMNIFPHRIRIFENLYQCKYKELSYKMRRFSISDNKAQITD